MNFDAGLLGSGTNITVGAVVPDATGISVTGFSGAADALYDAVFLAVTNTPISANGTFYTFAVVTHGPGSGSLSFDVTSLAAADGTNSPVPSSAGPPLDFTNQKAASVPEPNSLRPELARRMARTLINASSIVTRSKPSISI